MQPEARALQAQPQRATLSLASQGASTTSSPWPRSVTSPYVAPVGSCTVYRTVGGTSQGTIGTIASLCGWWGSERHRHSRNHCQCSSHTSGVLATATPIPPPYLTLAALQAAHPTCDITLA